MKKLLFFLVLFFLPMIVKAENLLIYDLTIENGELSLPFDSYNTKYTVTLEETEYHLEFNYKVSEGVIVSQIDNHDLENNSSVILTLNKGDEKIDYYFHILKDTSENILVFHENETEINHGFMFQYKLYIIPTICLLLIIIGYKIIFRKHKKQII